MKFSLLNIFIVLVLVCVCTPATKDKKDASISKTNFKAKQSIVDLTHAFSKETVYWVTAKEIHLDVVTKGDTDKGFFYDGTLSM